MSRAFPPPPTMPSLDSLDFDDVAPTTFDASPFALEEAPPPSNDTSIEASQVRETFVRARRGPSDEEARAEREASRHQEAHAFLDAMAERQLDMTVSLLCLESAAIGAPYDASARAALDTLRVRIHELNELHDALHAVHVDVGHVAGLWPLLTSDAALTAYTSGLYLFARDAIRALTDLATQLRACSPDWVTLRRRLAEAEEWHFDGLVADVRAELARLPPCGPAEARDRFTDHLEELFFAASIASRGLKKRFG